MYTDEDPEIYESEYILTQHGEVFRVTKARGWREACRNFDHDYPAWRALNLTMYTDVTNAATEDPEEPFYVRD